MNFKYFFTALILLFSISLFSQEDLAFFDLGNSQINIVSSSKGNYRVIEVEVSNFDSKAVNIHFPPGGFFYNLEKSEQDLVVLFYDKVLVESGKKKDVVIATACANPKRKAPLNGRTTWNYGFDKKIGDLILYYHENRSLVEMMTGAEHHNTFEKRHNFLQMCVWIYYDADKNQILDFATKYMFNGNKNQAQLFVDSFYPLAVSFINLYKNM